MPVFRGLDGEPLGVEFSYTRAIQFEQTPDLQVLEERVYKELQEKFQEEFSKMYSSIWQQLGKLVQEHGEDLQSPNKKIKAGRGAGGGQLYRYIYDPETSHYLDLNTQFAESAGLRLQVKEKLHLPWKRVITSCTCRIFTGENLLADCTVDLPKDKYATKADKPSLRDFAMRKALYHAGIHFPGESLPVVDFDLYLHQIDLPVSTTTPQYEVLFEAEKGGDATQASNMFELA